jgi:hypothetical protein
MTKHELFIITTPSFGKLIHYAFRFLFFHDTLQSLFYGVNFEYKKLENSQKFSQNEKQLLIELYTGFIYFLELLTRNGKLYKGMDLLIQLKDYVMEGKLNKTKPMFNQSKVNTINILCSNENIIFYRNDLLLKFRLLQRKFLRAIVKLRKIGPPTATYKQSKEIKKELNKNQNIDYKAYKIYCKYVLSKEENEDIYDFLAGIHKNSNGSVIHKNISNNNVNKIKINTKKIQHTEYIEKSAKILETVEDKIKEHGDIIDTTTKNQIVRIRKLFDSEQLKNFTLSFGNDNHPSIGGKIIQDCKTIRIINKKINELIKKHKNKYNKNKKQEKRKEVLKLFDNLKPNTTLTNELSIKEQITSLLGYDLLRTTQNLSSEEHNTINQIKTKLNTILPKSKS